MCRRRRGPRPGLVDGRRRRGRWLRGGRRRRGCRPAAVWDGTRLPRPVTSRDPRLDLREASLESLLIGPEDRVRGRPRGTQNEWPEDSHEEERPESRPILLSLLRVGREVAFDRAADLVAIAPPVNRASSRSLGAASRWGAERRGLETARLSARNTRRGPPATMKAVPPAMAAVFAGFLRTLAGMSTAVRADASSVSNSSPSAVRAAGPGPGRRPSLWPLERLLAGIDGDVRIETGLEGLHVDAGPGPRRWRGTARKVTRPRVIPSAAPPGGRMSTAVRAPMYDAARRSSRRGP